jgi:hypothetical protein
VIEKEVTSKKKVVKKEYVGAAAATKPWLTCTNLFLMQLWRHAS